MARGFFEVLSLMTLIKTGTKPPCCSGRCPNPFYFHAIFGTDADLHQDMRVEDFLHLGGIAIICCLSQPTGHVFGQLGSQEFERLKDSLNIGAQRLPLDVGHIEFLSRGHGCGENPRRHSQE
jgi:hypothetical protein